MARCPTPPPDRPSDAPASAYSREWIADHLASERRASSLLGEIREVVFGAQDGLVSTLAVVATVAGQRAGVSRSSSPAWRVGWRASSRWPPANTSAPRASARSSTPRSHGSATRSRNGRAKPRPRWRSCLPRRVSARRMRPGRGDHGPPSGGAAADDGHPRARHPGRSDRGGGVLRGALFMGAAFGLGAAVPSCRSS